MNPPGSDSLGRRHALRVHAAVALLLCCICVAAWAAGGAGTFWPKWVFLALGMLVAIHAALVEAAQVPDVKIRPLLIHAGLSAVAFVAVLAIWAISGHSSFWPAWVLVGLLALLGSHAILLFRADLVPGSDRSRLTERIEALTRTRAGAADAQADELRRIERNLHDGAQARLVSVSMSLGLARERIDDDPERARALIEEAQDSAMLANSELRSLVRGIAPPILADRGLAAAVEALPAGTGMQTSLDVDLRDRLPSAIEHAVYFVVSESVTNAAKHAGAERLTINIGADAGQVLVEVSDDGRGGADAGGSGLDGLRRRVEALDGDLEVLSPAGGGTTVRARMPLGSAA